MDDMKMQSDPHLKRIACQVYTQLPDDKREALQVLRLIRQLIFCLGEEWETVTRSAPILQFSQEKRDRGAFPKAVRSGPTDPQDRASQE